MKPISSVSTLAEYVQTFSNDLARKVQDQCCRLLMRRM